MMVKNFIGRKASFASLRRIKTGISFANHSTGRPSSNRCLTQFPFGAFSTGTLVHFSDPTYDHDY